jgi:NAD(P)H dehydrogenase (quinone)
VKFVDGNPYGVSLVATHDNIEDIEDIEDIDKATADALDHLARRVVTTARRLAAS